MPVSLRPLASCRWLVVGLALQAAGGVLAADTRVGLIGLRHGHSWRQLAEIPDLPEIEFVGVAESIPGLVDEARKVQPDAHFESDYRSFVQDRRPQIVWAFVENHRHLEIVEFLAPLGVHVIFEKPLAASYTHALRIRELAERHGIHVMTNYQMAWWPSNHEAHTLAGSGAIGEIWRLHGIVGNGGPAPRDLRRRVFFDWLTDPSANGGGALVDFGVYGATWAAWHLGLPRKVQATTLHRQPQRFPKVEDHATVVLTYARAVAVLEASWNLPRGMQRLEVFGTAGSLVVDRNSLALRKGRSQAQPVQAAERPEAARHPVRYLASRILERKPLEHIVALDLNVDAMQILEAARLSVTSGKAVDLPLAGPAAN